MEYFSIKINEVKEDNKKLQKFLSHKLDLMKGLPEDQRQKVYELVTKKVLPVID